MRRYPWYAIVSGRQTVTQGDIIHNFPILRPVLTAQGELDKKNAEAEKNDVIVMTQACDLENKKVNYVILCPLITEEKYFQLLELERQKSNPNYKIADGNKKGMIDNMIKGNLVNFHMLEKHHDARERVSFGRLIVGLAESISVDREYLEKFVRRNGYRARLLPPYREHLAQAFARTFMRIGLPSNIKYP